MVGREGFDHSLRSGLGLCSPATGSRARPFESYL